MHLFNLKLRTLSSFQGHGSTGAKSARFDAKGSRLLCSEIEQPLVCYNLPTLLHPKSSGNIRLSAKGYRVQKGSPKIPGQRTLKSPCCYAGTNDELIVGSSDDNGIYLWYAPNGEGHRKIDRSLRVLRGHRDVVRSVRYSVRNGVMASCGNEGIVKLWSIEGL